MPGKRRHFECVKHRQDGSFALAASSLTGNTWDGCVWLFDSWKHFSETANLDLSADNCVSGISDIAWYDNNRLLLALDSGELEIWQVTLPGNTMDCAATLSGGHHDMALCLNVLENNTMLSGGANGRVVVWNLESTKIIHSYKAHTHWVTAVAGCPSQSSVFVSSSLDGTVKHWDTRDSKPTISHLSAVEGGSAYSLNWSPNNEYLLAVGTQSGCVMLYDLRVKDKPYLQYQPHTRSVHRLAFPQWSADLLASVSDDKSVNVHRVSSNTTIFTSKSHEDFVHGLDWHPTDSHLLSCGWDGQLVRHNLHNGPNRDAVQKIPLWSNGDMEAEPSSLADNHAIKVVV